jgi:ABC-type lipoprotein export system ATPase subunit
MPTIPLQGSTDPEADEERARSLLAKVGLKSHLNYFPAKLSGGERQRVAVVRALINRPSLILADEPTGSLDQTASENLGRLLLDLNQEKGTALILVTHSQELAAQMGRVYHLTGGHLKN